MDPGVLAMITGMCPLFGSVAGAVTVIAAAKDGASGGFRRDNGALVSHLFWGGMSSAMIFTAPLYLPGLIAGALMLVHWL